MPDEKFIAARKRQLDLLFEPKKQDFKELFGSGDSTQDTVGEPVRLPKHIQFTQSDDESVDEETSPLSILRKFWKKTNNETANDGERDETPRNDGERDKTTRNDGERDETARKKTFVDSVCSLLRKCSREFAKNVDKTIDDIKNLDLIE